MNRGILIIIILFFISSHLYSQSLSFIKEKIEMTVCDSSFTISGKYYFHNKSDREIETSFYYPFVINENYLYPDSILILDENNFPIAFSRSKKGIYFVFKTHSRDVSEFTSFYRQKNPNNRAEYILTTTQNWNVPLQKAEYIVKLPNHLNLKFISLQPDSMKNGTSYRTYFITKENFMPLVNLFIEWGRREK